MMQVREGTDATTGERTFYARGGTHEPYDLVLTVDRLYGVELGEPFVGYVAEADELDAGGTVHRSYNGAGVGSFKAVCAAVAP